MAILKQILAIVAILGTAQSLAVLPADKTVNEPTPVLEKRWEETHCVSTNTFDSGDYEIALGLMSDGLGSGSEIDPQDSLRQSSGTAQVYLCNNENNWGVIVVNSFFNATMLLLDASCGVGVAGWIREHRTDIDTSYGRDISSDYECGF